MYLSAVIWFRSEYFEFVPIEAVEAVVNQMPSELLMELWTAVGEAVPVWGPGTPDDEGDDPKVEEAAETS